MNKMKHGIFESKMKHGSFEAFVVPTTVEHKRWGCADCAGCVGLLYGGSLCDLMPECAHDRRTDGLSVIWR